MIETLLNARLRAITENVYPNVAPLTYRSPCVVYQRLDTETISDISGEEVAQAFVTFQLAISSPIFGEAKLLARAVRNNLKSWQSDDVQAVSWINESVAVDSSTDVVLHRVLLFFRFICNEAAD